MIDQTNIDLQDPTVILAAVAEELAERDVLVTFEPAAGGVDGDDQATRVYECVGGDLVRVSAILYAAGEMDARSPAGWELTARFESARPPVVAQSMVGETLAEFVEAVAAAMRQRS